MTMTATLKVFDVSDDLRDYVVLEVSPVSDGDTYAATVYAHSGDGERGVTCNLTPAALRKLVVFLTAQGYGIDPVTTTAGEPEWVES